MVAVATGRTLLHPIILLELVVEDLLRAVIDRRRVKVKASMTKSTPLAEARVSLPEAMVSLLVGNVASRRALTRTGASVKANAAFARNPRLLTMVGGIAKLILLRLPRMVSPRARIRRRRASRELKHDRRVKVGLLGPKVRAVLVQCPRQAARRRRC